MKKTSVAICVLSLCLAACGSSKKAATTTTTAAPIATTTTTQLVNAADLRTKINLLMVDYAMTVSTATGALIGGRNDQSTAYSSQLNANGADLGNLIRATYGADAQAKFTGIWTAHTGYLFDYANGSAKADKATQDGAVFVLNNTFVPQFADFYSMTTGTTKDASTRLAADHVSMMKSFIDDQASKNWAKLIADESQAFSQLQKIAYPLCNSIAQKDSVIYPATGTAKASDFRLNLNLAFARQGFLSSSATDALVNGRSDEYAAFSNALTANATMISTTLSSVYTGDLAPFIALLQSQDQYFAEYAMATGKLDKPAQDKAINELRNTYLPQLSDFMMSAGGVDRQSVERIAGDWITQMQAVIDGQAAKKWTDVAHDDQNVATTTRQLSDAIASAFVHKLLV